MNVAITGANGYIGCYLSEFLLKKGYMVTTITRKPFSLGTAINIVASVYDEAHLLNPLKRADVLIHAAAVAHKRGCRSEYYQVNVLKSLELAKIAIKAGVKRFIYLSSIKVNGEQTTHKPFRYDSTPAPEDAYGLSKLEAETKLKELLRDSGTELVIIRPPLVWGGEMKGNLKQLQRLVRYRIPIPLKNIKNRRDIVSLHNLSSLISLVCCHPAAPGNVFLVSDGIARSSAEIAELLGSHIRAKPWLLPLPSGILSLLSRLPLFGSTMKKLIGNLEVDIQHSCEILRWKPEPTT